MKKKNNEIIKTIKKNRFLLKNYFFWKPEEL